MNAVSCRSWLVAIEFWGPNLDAFSCSSARDGLARILLTFPRENAAQAVAATSALLINQTDQILNRVS